MQKHQSFLIRTRHIWIAGMATLIVTVACGACLDREGGAGLYPPAEFSAEPRAVACANGHDTVTISWDVPQASDCTWEAPPLTGCNEPPVSWFIGGECEPPPPRCRTVDVQSDTGVALDPAVGERESSGERTVTLTETTTFTLLVDGEADSSLTVVVLNDTTVDTDPIPVTVPRTCGEDGTIQADPLDLTAWFSACVIVGEICNENSFPVHLVDPEDALSEILLDVGECTMNFAGLPRERVLVAPLEVRTTPYCTSSEPGMIEGGSGSGPPDPPDVLLTVDTTGCADYDAELDACLMSTTEPIVIDPSVPDEPGDPQNPPATICDPAVTCGDFVCDASCEETADTCPQDCGCFDDFVCTEAEQALGSCRDCSPGGCGAICDDSSQCAEGLACAGGVCWSADTCGEEEPGGGGSPGGGGESGGGEPAVCGNGIVEAGEQCDGSNSTCGDPQNEYCTNSCTCETLD